MNTGVDIKLKRFLAVAMMVFFVFVYGAVPASADEKPYDWTVYLYLDGSDLETNFGAATANMVDLESGNISLKSRALILAGGAAQWQNTFLSDPSFTYIIKYKDGNCEKDELPRTDMGAYETMRDFIKIAAQDEVSKHKMIIFWNHGAGTLGGFGIDEITGNIIPMDGIRKAFEEAVPADADNPPFDIIGFDACLMATIDTANILHGYGRYMVASEETEPANGWGYGNIVRAINGGDGNGNPISARDLSIAICDSYMKHCKENETDEMTTLSVVDLSKIPEVNRLYEKIGAEAFGKVANNKEYATAFSKNAKSAENYGGNTPKSEYYDMVDLGGMADNMKTLMPVTAQEFTKALKDAVVYKVNGKYRKYSNGLSGYYPLDADREKYNRFKDINSASASYKNLYGVLLQKGMYDITKMEDNPVWVDGEYLCTELPKELEDEVSEIRCNLGVLDGDDVILLGADSNVVYDDDTRIARDNFDGTWPTINGNFVFLDVSELNDDYVMYEIPIYLNGVECSLEAAYEIATEKYIVLDAHRINDDGIPDRNPIKLKNGDVIKPILYYVSEEQADDEIGEAYLGEFTVQGAPVMKDEPLGDGTYMYAFEFVSPQNESATSKLAVFNVVDGELEIPSVID